MEVKENHKADEVRQLILPPPALPLKGERQSPHLDVNTNHIGNEMEAGVTFGIERDDKGKLEELRKTLEEMNKSLEIRDIALNYSVDERTDDIVVKVIERSSDKVIRQIPPEEALRLRGHIKELLGMIFDENV